MKRNKISFLNAIVFTYMQTMTFSDAIVFADDAKTTTFELSCSIEKAFSEEHEKLEADNSLFDKFLKYSLLVTDKESLTSDQMELCRTVFETERAYMPYITCPYARETIKNGIAPARITVENKKLLADMAVSDYSGKESRTFHSDINYRYSDQYNSGGAAEYWLDDSGTERIICDFSLNNGPVFEKLYKEKPDYIQLDELVELCWGGGELFGCDDGAYMYAGFVDGRRYEDLLYPQKFTSGIWVYELTEDGMAYIIDCNLPKYSSAELIEDTFVLPAELDGHNVYGVGASALSGTGIKRLVIPENYQYAETFTDMNYLKEVEINAPELAMMPCISMCPGLESAVINVKLIDRPLFYGCDNLKTIKIDGAEGICCDAFSNLPSLSEVNLPENLRYIGQDAFADTAVKELVIPESVEIVGVLKEPYFENGVLIDTLKADNIRIADEDCVIKSYRNTEAHNYAIANGYEFIPLEDIAVIKGDINNDLKIDVTDLSELSLALIGDRKLSEAQQKAADVDKDGKVTLSDLARMRQYLSKVITSLG